MYVLTNSNLLLLNVIKLLQFIYDISDYTLKHAKDLKLL